MATNRDLIFAGALPQARPSRSNLGNAIGGVARGLQGFYGVRGGLQAQEADERRRQAELTRTEQADRLALLKAGIAPADFGDPEKEREFIAREASSGGSKAPSSVREFNFVQGLDDAGKKEFYGLKRAGQIIDTGSGFALVDQQTQEVKPLAEKQLSPAQAQARKIASETQLGKDTAILQNAKEIEKQKQIGSQLLEESPSGELKPIAGSPKFEAGRVKEQQGRLAKQQAIDNADVILNNATEALELIRANPTLTTGTAAKLTGGIAETPAGKVKSLLDTVSSNVALNKLVEIKAAGGTFGALQEKEFDALADSLGKLKNTSNPKILMQNIESVIRHYTNLMESFSSDLAKPEKYPEQGAVSTGRFEVIGEE